MHDHGHSHDHGSHMCGLDHSKESVPAAAATADANTAAAAAAAPAVTPVALETRGNYAVRLSWSDGHEHAFYTYDALIAVARREGAAQEHALAQARAKEKRQANQSN